MTKSTFLLTTTILLGALPCKGADDIDALKADMSFFTEPSCRELNDGVGKGDLGRFESDLLEKVASGLLNGKYDKTYRAADYEPYPSSRALQKAIKLGDGFSRYENITGMVLDAGKHVVFVGKTGGTKISLRIPEWMRKPPEGVKPDKDPNGWGLKSQTIKLRKGANGVDVE